MVLLANVLDIVESNSDMRQGLRKRQKMIWSLLCSSHSKWESFKLRVNVKQVSFVPFVVKTTV